MSVCLGSAFVQLPIVIFVQRSVRVGPSLRPVDIFQTFEDAVVGVFVERPEVVPRVMAERIGFAFWRRCGGNRVAGEDQRIPLEETAVDGDFVFHRSGSRCLVERGNRRVAYILEVAAEVAIRAACVPLFNKELECGPDGGIACGGGKHSVEKVAHSDQIILRHILKPRRSRILLVRLIVEGLIVEGDVTASVGFAVSGRFHRERAVVEAKGLAGFHSCASTFLRTTWATRLPVDASNCSAINMPEYLLASTMTRPCLARWCLR